MKVLGLESFGFSRSRGVVWVCDVQGSSRYLNDDAAADMLETFLPRLYWTSRMLVDEAGGTFIKWTGDGFIAWFETPLYRDIGTSAGAVFSAIEHLTLIVNVTQLATTPDRKFKLRHGVSYEHDALLTRINHADGHQGLDVMGRAVVLAFRLSGISAKFPGIVAQGEVVQGYRNVGGGRICFRKWTPSQDDRLRYFKNERWGTGSLFMSAERAHRSRSVRTVLKKGKEAVAHAEGAAEPKAADTDFMRRFLGRFTAGPSWCHQVVDEYTRFIRDELMGALKKALEAIEWVEQERKYLKDREI